MVTDLSYEFTMKNLNMTFSGYKEIVIAYLFGSRARGDYTAESDVDFAILISESFKDPYDFVRLVGDLATTLGLEDKKINLIVLNDASLELASKVISEGKVIFERDSEKRVEFEVRILKAYLDFKPLLDFMRKSLTEEYTRGEA